MDTSDRALRDADADQELSIRVDDAMEAMADAIWERLDTDCAAGVLALHPTDAAEAIADMADEVAVDISGDDEAMAAMLADTARYEASVIGAAWARSRCIDGLTAQLRLMSVVSARQDSDRREAVAEAYDAGYAAGLDEREST